MLDKGICKGLVSQFDTVYNNGFYGFRKMFREYLTLLNVAYYDQCCLDGTTIALPLRWSVVDASIQYFDGTIWHTAGGGSPITLTTTGTSGPATLISNVLNIPNYATGGSTNIYNTNGTLTGDRILDGGAHELRFNNIDVFRVQAISGLELNTQDGSAIIQLLPSAGGLSLQTDGTLNINGNLLDLQSTLFSYNGNQGTIGQVFTSQGAGSSPIWATPTGGTSFTTQTDTSGGNVTINNGTDWLIINPSSTAALIIIKMPATPTDRQQMFISFGGTVTSGPVVTNVSVIPNTSQTILQASTPSTVNAGESLEYKYNLASTTWYRI